MDNKRVHISQVLPHAEIFPLDEPRSEIYPMDEPYEETDQIGKTEAVSAFILIKTKDKDGNYSWAYRHTDTNPNREELLGALQVQVNLLRRELVKEWED